ncbi:MAG: hypothetical protein IKS46_01430, partial [Clostridia bacterium]|nr:hypothetical protein [Clostridia bacterium]
IHFTFSSTGAERANYAIYGASDAVASGDVSGSSFSWTPGHAGDYTAVVNVWQGGSYLYASVNVSVRPDYGKVEVTFTALDGATEHLADQLLCKVNPVYENGEEYPYGLNLTGTIEEYSEWPKITAWRMTSVNGIPETLILTIPEVNGELTKIELKLKEE